MREAERADGARGPRTDACLALVTAPNLDVGRMLARALVEARVAACVNLVPAVESIYRWEGAVEVAQEVMLLVKTRRGELDALERVLRERHPYQVPECIVLAPEHVAPAYHAWWLEQVGAPAASG